MMCDEFSVQRLCWISKKLWSLCWLSGHSWSGHLIMKWKRKVTWFKQKSVESCSLEFCQRRSLCRMINQFTSFSDEQLFKLRGIDSFPPTKITFYISTFLPLIDWWDHLESWRKMLHFDHGRGLLLFIFVDPGHTRRFIPIPGNISKCFTDRHLCIYTTVNDQIFFPPLSPLSRVFCSGNGCCWLFVEEKQKTIAFGNNIIAFVTSTMREKVMGRQNVFCSKHIDCLCKCFWKGEIDFILFSFKNFLTAAKIIRRGLVDKGKGKK